MAAFGYEMTRYADNFVIPCRTADEAAAAVEMVREWTTERGLTLHPTTTKIVHVDIDGFEFLGYRFLKHRRFPRQKSLAKFKETIRSKTKRTNGNSLQAIIVNVNRTSGRSASPVRREGRFKSNNLPYPYGGFEHAASAVFGRFQRVEDLAAHSPDCPSEATLRPCIQTRPANPGASVRRPVHQSDIRSVDRNGFYRLCRPRR